MEVNRHLAPIELLNVADDFFSRNEAECNLVIGICRALGDQPLAKSSQAWLLTISNHGEVVGVAVMTPPRHMILSRMPDKACEALACFLAEADASVPGFHGPCPTAQQFADQVARCSALRPSLAMEQTFYVCEKRSGLASSCGKLRSANNDDLPLLMQWMHDFHIEIGLADANEKLAETVEKMLASRAFVIWDVDDPVSSASRSRETENGVAVNYVYTPPERRGQGYATACVDTLTQRLLERKAFCCLYADKHNPVANRVYQRIGYRVVNESQVWDFPRESKD